MKKILVKNLLSIADKFPTKKDNEFKIHFAGHNSKEEPLDVFLRSQKEIQKWNEYKNGKVRFHKYIFTLVKFYHEKDPRHEKDTWLFVGIYEVLSNSGDKHEVRLLPFGNEYIGRLKILYEYKNFRRSDVNLKNHFENFEVKEILKEKFKGREFSGYENVHLSFTELENVYDKEDLGWKTALQNIKGIYLVTDKRNGKKYVGAAYEEKRGVWSRWKIYAKTGHGKHSAQLSKEIDKHGLDYARKNFSFALIEHYPLEVDRNYVLEREAYWKKVLLTGDYGYNEKGGDAHP